MITSVPDLLHFSTDPDPAMDRALAVSDLQEAKKKKKFHSFFAYYRIFKGTLF